jgi:hypothetical protein
MNRVLFKLRKKFIKGVLNKMALPLIPVIAALATGGTLVPHAAGGFIVSSAVSGYIAGTYISTAALSAYLASTGVIACVGLAGLFSSAIGSAAATIIGGAGIAGTTFGATGITGLLMSLGVISAVPVIVPILFALFVPVLIILGGCAALRFRNLTRRIQSAEAKGDELVFTNSEALLVERVLVAISRKPFWIGTGFLKFFKNCNK